MKQTTPTFKDIANRWLTEMACRATPVPGDRLDISEEEVKAPESLKG